MGFFSEDMAPMLGVYQAETSSLMASFDDTIARVEQEGAFADEEIAELFRSAHTIKGSSAMMGLDGLAQLTHRVEDLFDLLRGDPSLASGKIPDLMDSLYSFSDFIKDELGRMEQDDYAPADVGDLVEAVSADIRLLGGAAKEDQEKEASSEQGAENASESPAPADAADGSSLRVIFKADVPMVNARALVVVKQLGAKVKVFSQVPSDLASPEASQTISKDGLIVTLAPEDVETARQFLSKNSSIRRIVVLDEQGAASLAKSDKKKRKAAGGSTKGDKFVTLRWDNVNMLQDMAGEFLLESSRLKKLSETIPEEYGARTEVMHAARLVDNLVYHINTMAMVSVSALVPQLSRMVRDMCRQSGKTISFEVHGGDIEIDRNLYNSISDPLLHIIRNAVDHGIESPEDRLAQGKESRGKVTLTVESLGGRVVFTVSDDGRGVDTEKLLAKAQAKGQLDKAPDQYTHDEALALILKAGLSTADGVTQYSGRGVGMDVVNTLVNDFDGRVEIESELGQGTTISLYMAVSVTSTESLAFKVGPVTCCLALSNLDKLYRAEEVEGHLSRFEGSVLLSHNKHDIPVLDLHDVFGCPGKSGYYVACHSLQHEFALVVDDVMGEFSCSSKPLPSCFDNRWQRACGIRNVAVLEDGSIAFALNAVLLSSLASDADLRPTPDQGHDLMQDVRFVASPGEDLPSQLFVFTLGKDHFAVDVKLVERLMPASSCTRVPQGSQDLKGLANYRSRAVPVFDLAGSAGVTDPSSYVIVMSAEDAGSWGFMVTDAEGVRSTDLAVPAEDQPEQRHFTCGLATSTALILAPKTPPVTLLVSATEDE